MQVVVLQTSLCGKREKPSSNSICDRTVLWVGLSGKLYDSVALIGLSYVILYEFMCMVVVL